MRHTLTIVSVLTALGLATACGGDSGHTAPPTSAQPVAATTTATVDGQRGWVAGTTTEVDFLQWTRTASSVNGTLISTYLATTNATNLTTANDAFTGVISGNSLTLTFPQGFGSINNIAGTVNDSDVILSIPQTNGSIAPITFAPGAVTDFDARVATLQDAVNGNAQTIASEAVQAAQASASASESAATAASQAAQQHALEVAIDDAASALANDYESLTSDTAALAGDTSPAQALAEETTDLATTQHDAAAVAAEARTTPPGDAGMCSDATGVSSDASGVDSDNTGVQSTLTGITGEEEPIRSNLTTIAADVQSLRLALNAMPGYNPNQPAPSLAHITAAQAAGTAAVAHAEQLKTADTAQGNSLAQQAHAAADAARRAGSCS